MDFCDFYDKVYASSHKDNTIDVRIIFDTHQRWGSADVLLPGINKLRLDVLDLETDLKMFHAPSLAVGFCERSFLTL